ncbi:MAG: glycosyltransferase [Cyanobacteria bacterium J06627_15]
MRQPVLTIFYQFNPWCSSIGGIQTVVRNFIKFAPPSFDVRLVGTGTRQMPAGRWYQQTIDGRELLFFPLFNLENDDIRRWLPTSVKYTLSLLLKNFESDFIHFHRLEPALAALNWSGHKSLFIHNDIRTKIATTGNGGILWQRFPWAYFALERQLIHQFDQILSCNSDATGLYQAAYPSIRDRITTIRNTVDEDIFKSLSTAAADRQRQAFAHQMGLPAQTRFLLFAGRLHPQKDPKLLVNAFSRIAAADTHLLIAGEGELKPALKACIAQLGLEQRVTLLGAVEQLQLAHLYQMADAFVLSSAYEGLPMTVLEALSCGCPVVTTKAGETPRILKPLTGEVAAERTPEAFANALSAVLNHPREQATRACVTAAAPFGASRVIGALYQNLWQIWQQQRSQQTVTVPLVS